MNYTVFSVADTSLLKISCIGTSKDIATNRFGPGQRDYYCIHYVVKGKGYFNGNPVFAGQGFLIEPDSYQYYYPDESEPWEYVWINSKDPNIEDIFKEYTADSETKIFEFNSGTALENCISQLKVDNNKILSPSEILEMFLHIFNSHIKRKTNLTERNFDLFYKYAVSYINANLHRALTVTEITELIGIGQPYLYKIFKSKIGISPKEYINSQKIFKAKDLLRTTTLNVAEIGNSVGYADQLAFSKFFKDNTGVSPKAYRNKKEC